MTERREALRFLVRTPQGAALDERVSSLRVPSDTGQVGLRPRSETAALVVEPGLVLVSARGRLRFVATAGGLLRCDGAEAVLLTPIAVMGESAEAVDAELREVLGTRSRDFELRRTLQRFETGILRELRGAPSSGREASRG